MSSDGSGSPASGRSTPSTMETKPTMSPGSHPSYSPKAPTPRSHLQSSGTPSPRQIPLPRPVPVSQPTKSSNFSISSILSRPERSPDKPESDAESSRRSPAPADEGRRMEGFQRPGEATPFHTHPMLHPGLSPEFLERHLPGKPSPWYPWFHPHPYLQFHLTADSKLNNNLNIYFVTLIGEQNKNYNYRKLRKKKQYFFRYMREKVLVRIFNVTLSPSFFRKTHFR